jgi:hypothetical protein
MTGIRHIAPAAGGADLFATAKFERDVCVWSIRRQTMLAAFPTVLDFGGTRLCVIPSSPLVLVAAAYHVHGVCAYDVEGNRIWQRKDLKKAQNIQAAQDDDGRWVLSVGREESSLAVLRAGDGATVGEARGVKRVFGGGRVSLHALRSRAVRLVSPQPSWNWRTGLHSFAVLAAAFSPDEVVFSEAAGALRCFSLAGREQWAWAPTSGMHVMNVCWCDSSDGWLAAVWPYEKGGPHQFVRVDRKGRETILFEVEGAEHAFLGNGEFVVSSDGVIRDLKGRIVWRFQEDGSGSVGA